MVQYNDLMDAGFHFKNVTVSKNQMIGKNHRLCATARYFPMIAVCIILFGCTNPNTKIAYSDKDIPVIDLSKTYREMVFFDDDADREYIRLETRDDVLADRDFKITYISEQRIIGINENRGDVLIFDINGKNISSFNHKGQGNNEYISLISIAFDEKMKEVFIADIENNNRCLVFSEDGKFLRQLNYPNGSWISELYNFDEQTLFAYNRHRNRSDDAPEDINQTMPYVFLSKKDGSVVSRLDLSFPERRSDTYRLTTENGILPIRIGYTYNVKFGQEYIIADKSTDTVYVLTQDKKLTPLFVRTPSVFDENQLISAFVGFKTDTFLFFTTMSYDWHDLIKQYVETKDIRLPIPKSLAYNIQTGQLFSIPRSVAGINDAPKNTSGRLYNASFLVNNMENSRLNDGLRRIAATLDEEDNPVVEIIRYK